MAYKTIGKFYSDLPEPKAIANGAKFSFANADARCSVALASDKQSILLTAPGVYEISVNVTYVGTGTGTAAAQLYANGAPIPAARGAASIDEAHEVCSMAFDAVKTVSASASGMAALTLINAGIASSYIVDNVIVKKLA